MKEHRHTIRVRYGETDQMGVVYHANYLVFFEMGRTELLRAAGLNYRDMEAGGHRLVVTEATCRFRAPARYDDTIDILTHVAETGTVRMRFGYRICRETTLLAEGSTTLACLGNNLRPCRIPDGIISRLKCWGPFNRPE